MEPLARFELATPWFVARYSDTNELERQKVFMWCPETGSNRHACALDFESSVSTDSTTGAIVFWRKMRDSDPGARY